MIARDSDIHTSGGMGGDARSSRGVHADGTDRPSATGSGSDDTGAAGCESVASALPVVESAASALSAVAAGGASPTLVAAELSGRKSGRKHEGQDGDEEEYEGKSGRTSLHSAFASAGAGMGEEEVDEPEEVGGKGSPHRRCIATGEILPYGQMIRFVISPEGTLMPDINRVLPGRGYWVAAKHEVLVRALGTNAFRRVIRRSFTIPPTLLEQTQGLLRRKCLSSLGLARRAWSADCGYTAVRQALVGGKAGIVFVAKDAPEEFVLKLESVRGEVPVLRLFTTQEQSEALGRERLAFISVSKGQWTARLVAECVQLDNLSPS